MSETTILSGYGDSLMSSVTENNTYHVTTWGYPWPPQIHWLDPYLNLSSFSQEIIDAIVLGDKLKKEIRNYSDSYYGYLIDFRTDGDLADAYYNKYYANSTEKHANVYAILCKIHEQIKNTCNRFRDCRLCKLHSRNVGLAKEKRTVEIHVENL